MQAFDNLYIYINKYIYIYIIHEITLVAVQKICVILWYQRQWKWCAFGQWHGKASWEEMWRRRAPCYWSWRFMRTLWPCRVILYVLDILIAITALSMMSSVLAAANTESTRNVLWWILRVEEIQATTRKCDSNRWNRSEYIVMVIY